MSASSPFNTQKKAKHTRVPVARSKSFLGVIKDLVTAPLSWFADGGDVDSDDVSGKRRRPVQSTSQENFAENASRSKRQRVDSPERQAVSGYLDPPRDMFERPGSSQFPEPQSSYSLLPHNRSSSVFTHSNTIQRPPHNRHSVSPLVTIPDSQPLGMSRTMSVDLPNKQGLARDSAMYPLSREASLNSFTRDPSVARDATLGVPHAPFRLRTSLTPQPTGSTFGPTIKSRERDPSEPPPLTSLISNPIFVKAPPEPRAMSVQPIVTLGSITESQRTVRKAVILH
jgi:nucleoporin NUP1